MGNRQQSRLLAFLSNYERYVELSDIAANSANASQLQYLKTLDSIDAKTQQLKTSLQALYTESGLEEFYKGILDYGNNVVTTLTKMPKILKLPIPAIAAIGKAFYNLANVVTNIIVLIKSKYILQAQQLQDSMNQIREKGMQDRARIGNQELQNNANQYQQDTNNYNNAQKEQTEALNREVRRRRKIRQQDQNQTPTPTSDSNNQQTGFLGGLRSGKYNRLISVGASSASLLVSSITQAIDNDAVKAAGGIASSALSGVAMGSFAGVPGMLIGAGLGGLTGVIENWKLIFKDAEQRIKDLQTDFQSKNNELLLRKDETQSLESSLEKIRQLTKSRYDDNEAAKEFIDVNNELANKYPELIDYYDESGNAIINVTNAEQALIEAREESAKAAQEAAVAAYNLAFAEAEKQEWESYTKKIDYTDEVNEKAPGLSDRAYVALDALEELLSNKLPEGSELWNANEIIENFRTSSTGAQEKSEFEQLYERYRGLFDEATGGADYTKALDEYLSIINEIIKPLDTKVAAANEKLKSTARAQVSSIVQASISSKDNPVIKQLTNSTQFITDTVLEQYTGTTKKEWEEFVQKIPSLAQEAAKELNKFWTKILTNSQQAAINELIKNSGKYTKTEFEDKLKGVLRTETLDDYQQQIADSLYENVYTYENFQDALAIRIEKDANGLVANYKGALESLSNLGGDELKSVIDNLDKIQKDIDTGVISQKSGNEIVESFIPIWAMASTGLEEKQREQVQQLLTSFDSFTFGGVQELIDELEAAHIDSNFIDKVRELQGILPRNLSLDLQTTVDAISKGMSDYEKAISGASKGMDLKTAAEFAAKIGKKLTDLDLRDGLYYFDDIATIQEKYLEQYKEGNFKEEFEQLTTRTQAFLNTFDSLTKDALTETEQSQYADANVNKGDILNIYEEWAKDTSQDINEVVKNYYENQLAALGNVEDYLKQTDINNLLANGKVRAALKRAGVSDGNLDKYIKLLQSGEATGNEDIDTNFNEFREALNKNLSSILTSYIKSISEGQQSVVVSKDNINILSKLLDQEDLKEGQVVFLNAINSTREAYIEFLNGSVDDLQQRNKYLKEYDGAIAKTNKVTAIKNVLSAYDNISSDVIENFKNAFELDEDQLSNYGISYNSQLNKYVVDNLDSFQRRINELYVDKSDEAYIAAISAIEQARRTKSDVAFAEKLIGGANSIEEEVIADLANKLDISYEEATKLLTKNANGTYSASYSQLEFIIGSLGVGFNKSIQQSLAKTIDSTFSAVSNSIKAQTEGFTAVESLYAFANQIKSDEQLISDEVKPGLFEWNDALHAYILTQLGISEQAAWLKEQLERASNPEDKNAINQLVKNTARQYAENINVSKFISATDKSEGSKAEQELRRAIEDYYEFVSGIGVETQESTKELIQAFREGGTKAVLTYESIAKASGIDIDSNTVDSLYRLKVANLQSAQEALTGGVGAIIDESAYDLLMSARALHEGKKPNFNADQIGETGRYVITSVGDMVDVYQAIYNEMVESNVSTTAELNAAYAKVLEAGESEDSEMISALSDAAGMTYTRLGEVLAEQGYQLTQELVDSLSDANVIQKIGNKKIRITDFEAFSQAMGWVDHNSEEYTSALRSYNDSLIEINKRAKSNIIEETNNLISAKGGDWVNLSQIFSDLDKEMEEIYKERYLPKDYNGNVDNLWDRLVVSGLDMAKAYPNEGFTAQDYSTIFGHAFLAQDFGKGAENLAMTFASIGKAGEIFSDAELTQYVQDIINRSDGTLEGIKALDAAEKNLLLDIFQLAEGLSRDEALDEAGKRAFDLHLGQEKWDFLTLIGNERVSPLAKLNAILNQYGASLENGILKIQEDANVPAIIRTVTDSVEAYADLSAEETAKLLDSLNESLKQYVDLLTNGIGGKLNNQQASQLSTWAKTLGIDLTFTETVEGLKISRYEAEQLYEALKSIDEVQAQIVFKSLKEAFEEAGAECENISVTMANIARIQEQIAKAEGDTSGLQKRLSLYQEIARVQSADPNQYKFMDRKLPDGMQSPVNYWDAVGKMFTTLNDAASASKKEKGMLDVTSFYDIVNEMNNLAAVMGHSMTVFGMTIDGSAESAAALLEKGFSALKNVDGKGVKVALGEMGVNFSAGAEGMLKGVDDGIKTFAKSQIQMLDAAIQMLEALVAFEELGNVDIDNDGVFTKDDMFVFDEKQDTHIAEYTAEFQSERDKILKASEANEDLQKALDNFRIRNVTLRQLLTLSAQELKNLGFSLDDQYKIYKYISDKIKNGDFKGDLTDIQQLQLLFQDFNEPITIDTGSQLIQISGPSSYTINYDQISDEVLKNAIEQAKLKSGTREENIQQIKDIAAKAAAGKPITVAEQIVLGISSFEIQFKDDTNTYVVGGQEFLDQAHAAAARTLMKAGVDLKNSTVTDVSGSEESLKVKATKKIGNVEVEVIAGADQTVTYSATQNGETITSNDEEELVKKLALNSLGRKEDETISSEEILQYKVSQGIELAGEVKIVDEEKFRNATREEAIAAAQALANASTPEEINIAINALANIGLQANVGSDGTGQNKALNQVQEFLGVKVDDTLVTQLNGVSEAIKALGDVSLTQFSTDFAAITNSLATIQTLDATKITAIFEAISKLGGGNTAEGGAATTDWSAISEQLSGISTAIDDATSSLEAFNAKIAEISGNVDTLQKKIEALSALQINLKDNVSTVQTKINNITVPTKTVTLKANTDPLQEAVNKLDLKTTATVTYSKVTVPVPTPTPTLTPAPTPNFQYTYARRTGAKGNVALAKGTLMGELGPELYVSGGHYYVAGQNGAEFVNLPDDAIVFNHLQTKKLLEGHNINGRGDPVTSERAATSFAAGNARGDAMASASQALAALKQIRAMWQSMLDASMKDLGAKANSGGKGGGGSDKGNKTNAAFIADLERWYNLLRQIAKLESKINYEEQLRSKISSDMIQNGTAYYDSQKRTLDYLDQQIARQRELSNLQKSYYDARRQDLATSNYGKIFTFNDEGLMQYNDEAQMANGDRGGLFALAEIIRQNPDGSTVYTAQQQYEILKSWGFEQDMKYDDNGKEIVYDEDSKNADDFYTKSVQAFWDKVDAWKEELDSLYDDYNTKLTEILENEDQRNKILQEMIDNQISLEQKVVKAIEDREQKIIDEFEDTMEALQDSADKMIDGLNDQLDKERQMYENNNNTSETERLRRQLAILQRSGGSASQIRDLQNQIADRDREAYFEAQQQQIDAIQQASELEIERLDAQLNVMTETLEYQKENGLLWQEVYQVMSLSRDEIANFIMTNGSEWAPKSSVQIDNDLNSLRSSIEQWIARREDNDPVTADAQHNWNNYLASSAHRYGKVLDQGTIELAKAAYDSAYQASSDPNRAAEAADKILQTKLDEYFAKNPSAMPQRPEPKNIPTTTTTTPTIKSNDDDSSSKKSSGSGGSGSSSTSSAKKSSSSGGGWHYQLYNNHKADGSPSGAYKTREEAQKHGAKAARDHGYGWTYVTKWFKEGGLDDYTGLAVMHGTKTRPEAVFNAEQTKILRDDILSPKRTSLMSMLNSLRGYLDTGTTTSMVSNESNSAVTIDHLEFNMNASIANDYDARRAGENAMEEMVKIARKTSIQSLSRR